jgi:hypothetical protein
MLTIQRLYKHRDRAHELHAQVSAHKHTILQLLDRISILEKAGSRRDTEQSARQEALLLKQMEALKKATAKHVVYKTAAKRAEQALLRAEAEKQGFKDQIRRLQAQVIYAWWESADSHEKFV